MKTYKTDELIVKGGQGHTPESIQEDAFITTAMFVIAIIIAIIGVVV